ncbi:TatD family hydrolase [Anaerotignum sp. MSJ-24]|uniref:TatD family hydrolase n=1 Tax=Anaerotignum sp. MSJ-24 TaxID=2841521 RepID=UPI001C106C54|nr:TatD family hydrolase [Anaerotignum sp. MSJ-24]MBU5464472.1 TatD family hydrolase [Anaerotignum sp. MSJ-24]
MYFESHAHYDDERFDEDRDTLLASFPAEGIETVVNASSDIKSSKASIALSEKYPFFYAAVGVHPHEVENITEADIDELRELSKHPKVVAIGEIGLDYYYDLSPRDLQRHWFKRQLELADELKMPVIIHSRDAAQECFDIIKNSNVRNGVIHCYSGSAEMAEEYIKMGFYIGVGGSLTFKNNKKGVETVERIPIEKILIETDSPYLAPVPYRGKRNDSRFLKYVVERISQIKNIPENDICNITKNNAQNLFIK